LDSFWHTFKPQEITITLDPAQVVASLGAWFSKFPQTDSSTRRTLSLVLHATPTKNIENFIKQGIHPPSRNMRSLYGVGNYFMASHFDYLERLKLGPNMSLAMFLAPDGDSEYGKPRQSIGPNFAYGTSRDHDGMRVYETNAQSLLIGVICPS
jgi:hypothetical protein